MQVVGTRVDFWRMIWLSATVARILKCVHIHQHIAQLGLEDMRCYICYVIILHVSFMLENNDDFITQGPNLRFKMAWNIYFVFGVNK